MLESEADLDIQDTVYSPVVLNQRAKAKYTRGQHQVAGPWMKPQDRIGRMGQDSQQSLRVRRMSAETICWS